MFLDPFFLFFLFTRILERATWSVVIRMWFFFFNARVLVYGFVYNYVLHGAFLRRAPFFFFASASVGNLILLFFFLLIREEKKKGFGQAKQKKKDNAVKRALNRKLTLRWNARGIRCE